MTIPTLGDLAQTFVARRQTTVLKQQMSRLTGELSSGRTSDITRHLKGSFSQIADIRHRMQVQDGYRTSNAEAAHFTSAMQRALDTVRLEVEDLAHGAIGAGVIAGQTATSAIAGQATNALGTIVSALNTGTAGRPLFSGNDPDRAPLVSSQDILNQARSAIGTATDAPSIRAALKDFFDQGGGFDTAVYRGGTQDASPFRLGDGESVQLSVRADDAVFRDTLRFTVMAALAGDSTLDPVTQNALVLEARDGLLNQAHHVTRLQADLGDAEHRIEQSSVRIAAELSGLDQAQAQLLSVEPFETATALEDVQFQLESIYTVTARASRLNLMNFLS